MTQQPRVNSLHKKTDRGPLKSTMRPLKKEMEPRQRHASLPHNVVEQQRMPSTTKDSISLLAAAPSSSQSAHVPCELKCPFCGKILQEYILAKPHRIREHIYGHFLKQYRQHLMAYIDGNICTVCGKELAATNLSRHVGQVHHQIFGNDHLLPLELVRIVEKLSEPETKRRAVGGQNLEELMMALEQHFQVRYLRYFIFLFCHWVLNCRYPYRYLGR